MAHSSFDLWFFDKTQIKGECAFFQLLRIYTLNFTLPQGAYAKEYHEPFIDKKFTWCRDKLSDYRDSIAHPFLDKKRTTGFLDLENINTQAKLSAYSNLLERIAISILEEEFQLWGKLSGNPDYQAVSKSYTS